MPRVTNQAFKRSVTAINEHIKRHSHHLSKFTLLISQAEKLYAKYGGRCVMCGVPLNVRNFKQVNGLHLIFYTPLKLGGEISLKNIVPVCWEHAEAFKGERHFRQDIPDLNSFGDVVYALIKAVNEDAPEEKIRRIKRILNFKLEEVALNMRYVPFKDWEPESYEILEEDKNTLAESIVEAARGKDVAREITQKVLQMIKTRQYIIIRNQD